MSKPESIASPYRDLKVYTLSKDDISVAANQNHPAIDKLLEEQQYTKWAFFVLFPTLREISNKEINIRLHSHIISENKLSQFSFFKGEGVFNGHPLYGPYMDF